MDIYKQNIMKTVQWMYDKVRLLLSNNEVILNSIGEQKTSQEICEESISAFEKSFIYSNTDPFNNAYLAFYDLQVNEGISTNNISIKVDFTEDVILYDYDDATGNLVNPTNYTAGTHDITNYVLGVLSQAEGGLEITQIGFAYLFINKSTDVTQNFNLFTQSSICDKLEVLQTQTKEIKQSDWNTSDNTDITFIKNKPDIVNSSTIYNGVLNSYDKEGNILSKTPTRGKCVYSYGNRGNNNLNYLPNVKYIFSYFNIDNNINIDKHVLFKEYTSGSIAMLNSKTSKLYCQLSYYKYEINNVKDFSFSYALQSSGPVLIIYKNDNTVQSIYNGNLGYTGTLTFNVKDYSGEYAISDTGALYRLSYSTSGLPQYIIPNNTGVNYDYFPCKNSIRFVVKDDGKLYAKGNTFSSTNLADLPSLGLGILYSHNYGGSNPATPPVNDYTEVPGILGSDIKQLINNVYTSYLVKNDGTLWVSGKVYAGDSPLVPYSSTIPTNSIFDGHIGTFTQLGTDNDWKMVCRHFGVKNDNSVYSFYDANGNITETPVYVDNLVIDDLNIEGTFIYNLDNVLQDLINLEPSVLPTLTSTDRAIVLDSADNKPKFWDGTVWNNLY